MSRTSRSKISRLGKLTEVRGARADSGDHSRRLIKEMQAEDEELGLGAATSAAATPRIASTSRSPSPAPSAADAHDTDAQLAASLNAGLDGLDGAAASSSDHSATESEEEEVVRPKKGKKGKAVKRNQPPPGAVFESDQEEAALAARRKGKRGGRGAGPTPLDVLVVDGEEEGEEDLGGMVSKGKKGRRAKGKGSVKGTPAGSGVATPMPPAEGEDGGEQAEGGAVADEAIPAVAEMSKKEKRRAKEAAKKLAAANGANATTTGAAESEFVSGCLRFQFGGPPPRGG